ncbi:VanZ family protein [Streptomyces sp. NPDC048254]|uniref:VanZ family protein n=2 Tax=unclassified Streptomyces TaxID=2593676 RepID=UPI00371228F1
MASAASRLRTTKAEKNEGTNTGEETGKQTGVLTKVARAVGVRRAEPDAPTKAGTGKAGGTGKKGRVGKAGRTDRTSGAGKTGGTGRASRTARATGTERRPLPLPLRVLAMLCAFAVMVAFAVVLARLTLDPSPASVSIAHTNLHPGRSLKIYLDQPALRDAVKQIGGNIVLGIPFGIIVPVLVPRARGFFGVLLLTAFVMLMVETAQGLLVEGRAFDVDDVILNTSGALIGWVLLGRRLGRAVHARKPKKAKA